MFKHEEKYNSLCSGNAFPSSGPSSRLNPPLPLSDTSRHSSCLCSSGRSMLCCAFERGREEKERGPRPKNPIGVSPPSRCCSMHHSSYISKEQKQVSRRYESAKFEGDFTWKLYHKTVCIFILWKYTVYQRGKKGTAFIYNALLELVKKLNWPCFKKVQTWI